MEQDLVIYKNYVAEIDEPNYDAPDERIVTIYKSMEDYKNGDYILNVSLKEDDINNNIKEYIREYLLEEKLQEATQEADLPDLTWILTEYDTDIATKEELGSDYFYRKLLTNTNEAERYNYHSDYWGDADTYQEEMVHFVGIVEPYVGKNVIIDINNESYTYKVLGVLIDTQYNSLGHACILVEEPEREIQGDKVEESKEETYYYEIHFDYTKESGKDSDGYSKFFKSKKAVPNETNYVIDLALDENILDDDDKADIEYIDYAQQIDEIDYRDATGEKIDESKPIIKRKSDGETLTKSQIRDKYKEWREENGWTKDEYSYNDYLRDIDESGEWELIEEATNLQDMRNSNLDWFKNMGYEEYKTGDNFICLANTTGEDPVAVMFYGKAAKPRWHYKFRSIDELEQYVNKYLDNKQAIEQSNAERREKRKLTKDHNVKVGDIFYTYWGYDQTNSEFYEVVEVKGSRLYLKEIGYETDDSDSSWGQDKIKPIPGDFIDEEIHKASVRADGTVTNLDGESFLSLSKYEGGYIKVTASGWGH